MKIARSLLIATVTFLAVGGLTTAIVHAQQMYRYRCGKCGLIQTYSSPGMYRCPNDGATMFRQ